MPASLTNFHFLRPWWLLLAAAGVLVLWADRARRRDAAGWRGVVASALLPWMLVTVGKTSWVRPAPAAMLLLALAALALAGPTWRREPSPFVADQAVMIVALDLSKAGEPLLPAAKRKIRDIVAARGAAKTGLVAYAGTAHLVLPPASDPRLIETFLDALSPAVMPRDGRDAAAALALALRQLDGVGGAGTVVLVTPLIPAAQGDAFARALSGSRHAAIVLSPGPALSGALVGARGAAIVMSTPDMADVRAVLARTQRHFAAGGSDDPTLRWADEGAWLALALLPVALLWSRRGFLTALALLVLAASPARAAAPSWLERLPGWFERLWLTPDQQGRLAFERGDYAAAAALFTDPMWRGAALYRAGDFPGAIAALAALDTAEAWFDRGNAHMMQAAGWNDALAAYDHALALRPAFPEARVNRALAAAFVAHQQALEALRTEQAGGKPNLKADDVVADDQRRPTETKAPPRGDGSGLSDDQVAALWMRRVGGSPAEFLKLQFARQAEGAR